MSRTLVANQIVGFVEDTDLSSLGVAGLVVVLFSVIRLLGSVGLFLMLCGIFKSHVL